MRLLIPIQQPDSTGFHQAWLMECSNKHQFVCDDVLRQNCEFMPLRNGVREISPVCPNCGEDNSVIHQLDITA